MTKSTFFDVLIVYSQRLADSAGSNKSQVVSPFSLRKNNYSYNTVYGYFLKSCKRNNLKAAFTTSKDIQGPGICSSYWMFDKDTWTKVLENGSSRLVFDKFSPISPKIKAKRELLFSNKKVIPFNHSRLFSLFFDKQKTYKKLARFSIPTVQIIGSSQESISKALKSLNKLISKHNNNSDFTIDIILKDQYGAGGINIYKLKNDDEDGIRKILKKHPSKSFIIQPFVNFDLGFAFDNVTAATDIRLIYLNGKIVQTYLRMAKQGDFRCNEHQGGQLQYISRKDLPKKVVIAGNEISKLINKKGSLFALDFIVSNNGNVYLLEGNSGPGLDWNLNIKKNEIEAKKLINLVVKQIANRVTKNKINKQKSTRISPFVQDHHIPILPLTI